MNNGKICISLCAKTADTLFEQIDRAEPLADVIEIRFDCLDPQQIDYVLEKLPKLSKQYLLTYRPSEQGGLRVLPLSERIMFWKRAVKSLAGHNFLADHEADVNFPFGFDRGRIIRSKHYFGESPSDLRPDFFDLSDESGGVVKIAINCSEITDAIKIWRLIETAGNEGTRLIPIAMGEAGKWTRILGPAHGAYITYASLEADAEAAPGQISAADMIDVFRVKELSPETQVYGIVAGNTSYSVSPWMHNASFKAAGMDRVFVPLQVADLDQFFRRMVKPETRETDLNFAGFSVTNPHKQTIMGYLDEIDEIARTIGAVNTVKIDDGKLFGYNTDAPGFIAPLIEKLSDLKGSRAAIVGAGGAARACTYALRREGADVTLFARDSAKAEQLANEFGISMKRFESSETDFSGFDILVNTTPLGTKGENQDRTIATAEQLRGLKLVYDLNYNPAQTRLLREAEQAGTPSIGGFEMLIAQGAKQFEIWTQEAAPIDAMAEAVGKRLR